MRSRRRRGLPSPDDLGGEAGAYGVVALLAIYGLGLFFRRRLEQWGWKVAGGTLLVLTLASFEGAILDLSGDANTLAGGYFGEFVYSSLLANVSLFGTYLLLILGGLVAFLISTDTVVYPAVAKTQAVLLDPERLENAALFLKERARVPGLEGLKGLAGKLGSAGKGKKKKPKKKKKPTRKAKKAKGKGAVGAKTPNATTKKKTAGNETSKAPAKVPSPVVEEEDELEDAPGNEDEEYEYEYVYEEVDEDDPNAEYEEEEEDEEEEDEEEEGDEDEDEDEEEEEDEEAQDEDEDEDEDEEVENDDDAEEGELAEADENDGGTEAPATGDSTGTSTEDEDGQGRRDPRPSGIFKIREPDELTRKKKKAKSKAPKKAGPYNLPQLNLIEAAPLPVNWLDKNALTKTAGKIESTLGDFKIDAQVVEATKGPTITQFEISLAAGIKVHKIVNLSDDLAMALKAQSIRIIAPIPGKSTVGIEVPNGTRSMVGVRELIEVMREDPKKYKLPLALGRDTAGNPVIGDLGEMPHLLIAGSTGSGKSVCINSIIISILMTKAPDEVKLILLDPKMVELAQFEKIPHLLSPVVTDMKKAPSVLNWLVDKMEERYELLAMAGVRHLSSYNELGREKLRERLAGKMDDDEIEEVPEKLPFVVVIIDELADLMMTAAKEVEGSITRLSQKSRAVGIHVILATQRPSVDVITGLIKANMPSRVSFRVTSRVDSRTILDRNGADKLLGKGDCLFLPPGTSDVMRVQGAFISDKEIRDVVQSASREAEPQYNPELTRFGIDGAADGSNEDELFDDAVGIVLGSQRGSVTLLQRQLQIGYTRASRLMELMHERGLVGPFQGSKAREVYYTLEEWEKSKGRSKASEEDDGEGDE